MIEHSFKSSALNWIRYCEATKQMEVAFQTGVVYRYWDVPKWRVLELIAAPSAGRCFRRNIASEYRFAPQGQPEPLESVNTIARDVKNRSISNIRDHIPDRCFAALTHLFDTFPVLVHVTARRKTKHGDYRLSRCRRYGIISVNASGNSYQFLITLLHEFAHAETYVVHGPHVQSHGSEWKIIFRRILLDFANNGLFPESLAPFIRLHASSPRYSSSADSQLQLALRSYDTLDERPIVAELPFGQVFSLDGKLVLIKREQLKTRYKCVTTEGYSYRVSGSARVKTLYADQKSLCEDLKLNRHAFLPSDNDVKSMRFAEIMSRFEEHALTTGFSPISERYNRLTVIFSNHEASNAEGYRYAEQCDAELNALLVEFEKFQQIHAAQLRESQQKEAEVNLRQQARINIWTSQFPQLAPDLLALPRHWFATEKAFSRGTGILETLVQLEEERVMLKRSLLSTFWHKARISSIENRIHLLKASLHSFEPH